MALIESREAAGSATVNDVVRLWRTLVVDYVPGLKLELEILCDDDKAPGIRVLVCDYSTITNLPMGPRSVWAVREYHNPLYLISISQLFDLLISAYRVMDEYFVTGKDNRPRPVKG